WTDHRAAVAARAEEEPAIDTVLRPGDALYLPRGYLHAAEALGDVSCHLTVGVHPVTRHAVLESLLDLVSDDAALRASLPLGVDIADPASVAPDVEATVAALVERLRTVTAADVADRLGARLVGSSRPAPVAPLAQAAALQSLSLDSVLVARSHQPHVLRIEGEQLLLRLFDRTLTMPVSTTKAVRALLEGEPLRVGDLPDLDADVALALARRLVGESIAVVAVVDVVAAVDDGP
ncbi:MAG: cupin domain-containing protein, partial [Spirochaetaceae bacterium]|nr:cupin domain-containing protein [Spirochaetaceae bacterium]